MKIKQTVKPVYKGHSREPENVVFMNSGSLYTKLYVLFINGGNETGSIDSDLLYRGALNIRQIWLYSQQLISVL